MQNLQAMSCIIQHNYYYTKMYNWVKKRMLKSGITV